MSRNIFLLLSIETTAYVMDKVGISLTVQLPDKINKCPRIFKKEFGEAVWHYRNCHKEAYRNIIGEYTNEIFVDTQSIVNYSSFAMSKIVSLDCFLMDVLRIFAFCTDLSILCHLSGHKHLVSSVLSYINMTYLDSLMEPLSITGFQSLFSLAEQLLEYRTLGFVDEEVSVNHPNRVESPMKTDTIETLNTLSSMNSPRSSSSNSDIEFIYDSECSNTLQERPNIPLSVDICSR